MASYNLLFCFFFLNSGVSGVQSAYCVDYYIAVLRRVFAVRFGGTLEMDAGGSGVVVLGRRFPCGKGLAHRYEDLSPVFITDTKKSHMTASPVCSALRR